MTKRKRSVQTNGSTLKKKKKEEFIANIEISLADDIKQKVKTFYERRKEPSNVDISEWKAKRALSNWYLGYPKRALKDAVDSMCENHHCGKATAILQSIGCVVPKGISPARVTRSTTIASNILISLQKTLAILSKCLPKSAANFIARYRDALRSFQEKEFSQALNNLKICYDICNKNFSANRDVLCLLDSTKEIYAKKSAVEEVEPYSLIITNDAGCQENIQEVSLEVNKKSFFANNAEALLERSVANLMLNDLKLAVIDTDNLLLLEPNNIKAHFCRAMVLIDQKDYSQASIELNTCLESLPQDHSLLDLLHVVEQEYRASMNRFPDDVLIKISEILPLEDRFSAELINKRWHRCMKKYGWRNVRVYKDHGTSRAKYLSLFKRCGNSLVELRVQHSLFLSPMWSLLPMLKNIQHISLSPSCFSAPDLKIVAESFPKLVSAEFFLLGPNSQEGLTFMLKNCKELKYLKLRELKSFSQYDFAHFPSSLKCLDVDHTVNCSDILSNAVKNGCRLDSLKIFAWAAPYLYDNSFYFESLKYLCVYVQNVGIYVNFACSLANLPNLRALDVWSGLDGRETVMVLEAIVANCRQLEHFSLNFHSSQPVVVLESNFDQICDLPKLTSVCIGGNFQSESGGRPSLQKFFERITSYGNLKYFKIKSLLSIESVCNALKICKNLNCLGWRIKNESEDWKKLLDTIDEIHDGRGPEHELPILKLFCYCGLYRWPDNMPYHPWLKFCTLAERSIVREKHRVGCLSSTPTFARDH